MTLNQACHASEPQFPYLYNGESGARQQAAEGRTGPSQLRGHRAATSLLLVSVCFCLTSVGGPCRLRSAWGQPWHNHPLLGDRVWFRHVCHRKELH